MRAKYYIIAARITGIIHGLVIIYFLSLIIFPSEILWKWYSNAVWPIIVIQFLFIAWKGICPLTILENYFRVSGGDNPLESSGFIAHHIYKISGVSVPNYIINTSVWLVIGILFLTLLKNFLF